MAILKTTRNMGPGYYHLARFWRREIPFRDKWRHATEKEYGRLVFRLNLAQYQKISQHKVVEKSVLSLFGIPTPAFIGFFHGSRGRDRHSVPLRNSQDMQRLLFAYAGKRVCFKAVEGDGGRSFSALDVHSEAKSLSHPLSDKCWTMQEWTDKLSEHPQGWIMEE